ncbi:hypothetical protein P280DRAFT_39573 [Massarina eburnea CBS 473.64]|uniref:Uncharacterized protein n=1 Tax=Massarina eburnea CBS 473.64 TaxID=1395130 RepID=A0A6A6RVH2_9PLEO|nr:hypothetical protein P280DRAFT_39573 [Massarina eburnea CBS 473.64]
MEDIDFSVLPQYKFWFERWPPYALFLSGRQVPENLSEVTCDVPDYTNPDAERPFAFEPSPLVCKKPSNDHPKVITLSDSTEAINPEWYKWYGKNHDELITEGLKIERLWHQEHWRQQDAAKEREARSIAKGTAAAQVNKVQRRNRHTWIDVVNCKPEPSPASPATPQNERIVDHPSSDDSDAMSPDDSDAMSPDDSDAMSSDDSDAISSDDSDEMSPQLGMDELDWPTASASISHPQRATGNHQSSTTDSKVRHRKKASSKLNARATTGRKGIRKRRGRTERHSGGKVGTRPTVSVMTPKACRTRESSIRSIISLSSASSESTDVDSS